MSCMCQSLIWPKIFLRRFYTVPPRHKCPLQLDVLPGEERMKEWCLIANMAEKREPDNFRKSEKKPFRCDTTPNASSYDRLA